MLGQLVSMRDEEVVHAVHGGIGYSCLFPLPRRLSVGMDGRREADWAFQRGPLLSYAQWPDSPHGCAAEAITGEHDGE